MYSTMITTPLSFLDTPNRCRNIATEREIPMYRLPFGITLLHMNPENLMPMRSGQIPVSPTMKLGKQVQTSNLDLHSVCGTQTGTTLLYCIHKSSISIYLLMQDHQPQLPKRLQLQRDVQILT